MSRPRSVSRGSPERKPGQPGRPRKKGKRLPTLAHRLGDGATTWTALTIARWYGQGERQIEMATSTAVWYHSGMEPVPLRWVLIRDPQGKFEPQALLCTDQALHRPGSRAGTGCLLVYLTLAGGSHVSAGANASGRGDAAAVER